MREAIELHLQTMRETKMNGKKDRNGLPLSEFLKGELSDKKVRKHYETARAASLGAKVTATARKRAH
jgi:hypothetical protein